MDTNPEGSAKTVGQGAEAMFNLFADDPDESQQVESEEIEQAEAEYDDEPEVEEQPTPTYKVKVGKEELEVPLDELVKGYSRTADYTRKTQEIAEQRKVVEAERQKIEEAARLRDTYSQRLSVIEQMLSQGERGEDLAVLKESDPIGYAVKVAEQAEREKQLSAVRAERQRIAQQQQAEHQEKLQAHLQAEAAKLAEAIPEMSDQAKSQAVKTDIRNYAKSIGFTDQELAQVYDSRAVLALYKAAQYDKLVAGKQDATKKVAQAPKMLKPGSFTPEAKETEAEKRLRVQLKKSGSKSDAARLFERFL
jgi:hypothetical protein